VFEGPALGHTPYRAADWLRFAAHWDFRIRACRPYRARTKGKVERPVGYVRQSFFVRSTTAQL
jgi:transposase